MIFRDLNFHRSPFGLRNPCAKLSREINFIRVYWSLFYFISFWAQNWLGSLLILFSPLHQTHCVEVQHFDCRILKKRMCRIKKLWHFLWSSYDLICLCSVFCLTANTVANPSSSWPNFSQTQITKCFLHKHIVEFG